MRIPGKIFSLRLGSHYAVEATICKKSTANLTIQGEVFLEKEPLPGYYSKNRVASAQFLTCVTIARPAAAASIFRHSFLTPREKLRLKATKKKPTGCLLGACSGQHPMGYRFSLLTLLFSGVITMIKLQNPMKFRLIL